jgi:hypothetical protein
MMHQRQMHRQAVAFSMLLFVSGVCHHVRGMDSNPTPPDCYADAASRHQILGGGWRAVEEQQGAPKLVTVIDDAPYWNLSCPFEWSKYSCVHQGAAEHALEAVRRQFHPTSGCRLRRPAIRMLPDSSGELAAHPPAVKPGRTIIFIGDSLLRQVFLATACLLKEHIDLNTTNVKWPACVSNVPPWPCHGTQNCIGCGSHSGFAYAKFKLKTGGLLMFFGNDRYLENHHKPKLVAGDVVVFELGNHAAADLQSENANKRLNREIKEHFVAHTVKVIYFITPNPSFKSPDGDGVYNPEWLAQKNRNHENTGCQVKTSPVRPTAEWATLHFPNNSQVFRDMHGVVDLEGLSDQGDLKIGGTAGTFGDCRTVLGFTMDSAVLGFARWSVVGTVLMIST